MSKQPPPPSSFHAVSQAAALAALRKWMSGRELGQVDEQVVHSANLANRAALRECAASAYLNRMIVIGRDGSSTFGGDL